MLHLSEEVLNEYLDGALDGAARQLADAHLAGCSACRAQLDELRNVFVLLSTLADEASASDLATPVRSTADTAWPIARGRTMALLAAQGGVALILLAISWPGLSSMAGLGWTHMLADWSAWLVWQAASWELGSWLTKLAGYAGPPAWPDSMAAIIGPTSVWGVALAGALAAWLAGNRLLLRDRPDLANRGGENG
jgi:predicted anti-sigma-YlaC factor YlaD